MRDLQLWQRLVARTATVDDVLAIASWSLGRRVAYVGPIAPLVEDGDPVMRAAALRALAGARGVEGVRAIVARLDDDEPEVRLAAVAALREVARDAPYRYVHALFHPRADVRRAALGGELSLAVSQLAVYLRADPACADLARKARWPEDALPLAVDFYTAGHLPAGELVELFLQTSVERVRAYIERGYQRPADVIETYLDQTTRGRDGAPPGHDVLDTLVRAIRETGAAARTLEHFVDIVTPKKQRALARRAAVALLAELAHEPTPALWGACIAVEPRVIGSPGFDAALAPAAVAGLFRFKWPVRPTTAQVQRLLELPVVEHDLALAAAVTGLLPANRLRRLAGMLGEDAIIAALRASDHGWDEICRLPPETPPLELEWLARIEKADYKRYIVLAGRALGSLAGTRRDAFVEQMPRRHRPGVFLAALGAHVHASDERIASVAKAIGARVDRTTLVAILQELARTDENGRLLLAIVRAVAAKLLGAAAADLDDDGVLRLLGLVEADPIPRDREVALAAALRPRTHPVIADWCARIGAVFAAHVSVPMPTTRTRRELTPPERHKIATCSDHQLHAALEPVFSSFATGLVAALGDRAAGPSVDACNGLLGCADPLVDVARALERFSVPTAQFDADLDNAAARWLRLRELPVLANARLWRWELHLFAVIYWMDTAGGPLAALQIADSVPGRLARDTLWKALSEGLMLLRYRTPTRFQDLASHELALVCAGAIDRDIGRHAARILAALVESGNIAFSSVRDRVLDRIADADAEARSYIGRLVRLEGVPEPPQRVELPAMPVLEQIRTSTDLDALARWCADPRASIVQEAALALVVLGPAGQLKLAELVRRLDELPAPTPLLATILLWDHAPALDAVRAVALDPELPPAPRFHLSLSLAARGEPDALPRAVAAVRAEPRGWYFRREDWDALARLGDLAEISIALADAPHHHAYQRALNLLLSLSRPTPAVQDALHRFLEVSADRPLHLRVAAARYLAQHWRDPLGLPLLAEYIADERADDWPYTLELVPPASMPVIAETIVAAALAGGPLACSEKRMWAAVQRMRDRGFLTAEQHADLDLRIFEEASTAATRRAAAAYAVVASTSQARLHRVAEVFAWGIRRGVELTGQLYRVHMTAKERDLGHTKLDANHIFVSPLPMLRGEPHGQDVVEGLLLHELGHHVYHRGEQAQAIWNRAHGEGIGHFLNLIADEHLERNLRALDPAYGDRLKRLGAYAFQHAPQEIKVPVLFDALGAATAHAFTHGELAVAYDEEAVRVRRGAILGELDRAGHPVARFSRALRMGLGNRANDPLIGKALALCGKDLRTLDMRGLYELTRQLVALFGGKHQICKVFGGPEGLEFGEREDDVAGAGVDDDVLQREVERILDPRRGKRGAGSGPRERLAINVNPDTKFDRITRVVRVTGDEELHRRLALDVHRHSARLRTYLDELGLRWLPVRARTQGRALDRTRLRALVTRNDPRILIARNPVRKTDLFLGTLVDCSSSMTAGQNIDRAKRFAVLVAEAVRTLPGVEARFFGFTESEIYDAGSASQCGVVGLRAGGGNNDAAALYHAANVALGAPQRAKVLVMISDGLPTDCSVAALRSLVTQLTRRRGILCAQVAVRRLEEVCFPHHVVLDDRELDIAVARFGRMIGDLARRSLAS